MKLREAKDRKKREIERKKRLLFYRSVTVTFPDGIGDIQFRNELDRSNLSNISTAALNLMQVDPSSTLLYRTEDNITHTVPASGMALIAMEVLDKKQQIVSAAWTHKDNIDSLNTVEEVLNYDITIGWPE